MNQGADELDAAGCGLNVRDAVMEKIFVVDSGDLAPGVRTGASGEASSSGAAEKEEGEVKIFLFKYIKNILIQQNIIF